LIIFIPDGGQDDSCIFSSGILVDCFIYCRKTSAPKDRSKAVSIIFSGLTLATVLGVPWQH
jgi:predicted MFS family arabinose efflux permease